MPPTGSTRPRKLISPVIAVSLRIVRPVNSEVSAMNMATPAQGRPWASRRPARGHGCRSCSNTAGSIPSCGGAVLDQAQRRLGAFLHHLAQLAGQDQPAGARDARRLDEQDVAADRRPGQAGRDAGHAVRIATSFSKRGCAEDRRQLAGPICDLAALPSATRTAACRSTRPISRSSQRTPASRV